LGHQQTAVVIKSSAIGNSLKQVREDLCGEFKELSPVASDALLYVKEDLIVPQDLTFYDLIVTKAWGKSGPFFHFDVHKDMRLGPLDSWIEKDKSHPGKVVEQWWYKRNKHIFPAS
jgi:protein FAM50